MSKFGMYHLRRGCAKLIGVLVVEGRLDDLVDRVWDRFANRQRFLSLRGERLKERQAGLACHLAREFLKGNKGSFHHRSRPRFSNRCSLVCTTYVVVVPNSLVF
jgi:hypothetical protein